MTPHSGEEHFDELLQLLEQERAWSAEKAAMSGAEEDEHHERARRINDLVLGMTSTGEGEAIPK